MAVFCGPQGTGKSSLSAALAMDINWFTDATHLDEESKELVLLLSGVCVAEISEMTSKKGDIDKVKAQISKQTDKGRPAYGRVVISRPRRNIFVGSTNSVTPLTDEQNRRFLPVMVKQEMNLAWLRAALWQLIGEAAHHESRGDTFAIPREVWADAQAHQEAARAESTLEIQMADWFAPTELTGRWQYITAADLVDMVRLSGWRGNNAALSQNMEKLEFRQERIRIDGKQLRVWVRGPECLPTWILKEGVRYLPNKDNIGRVFAVPRLGAQQPGTNVLPFNKPDTK
jgi:predicted P-loop ATPase